MKMSKIAEGPARNFQISLGLSSGYSKSPTKQFSLQDVSAVILRWIASQIESDQPYLTGQLVDAGILYGWKNSEGITETRNEIGALFQGHANVIYNSELDDESIINLLNELAHEIAADLDQTRIYLSFREKSWVLQRDDQSPPIS